MIKKLNIKNLAIIDDLSITFHDGLNIITGQTGAGKSIIINSITYLLGSRFNKELIRSGEIETTIEGVFDNDKDEVVIKRIFNINGKSKNFVDNKGVPLSALKMRCAKLIDMHGQHEHHKLLDQKYHISLLDLFGKNHSLIDSYKSVYNEVEHLSNDILLDRQQNELAKEKYELYDFQKNELSKYEMDKKVESDINNRYKYLSNIKILQDYISQILDIINGEMGLFNQIKQIDSVSRKLNNIDHTFNQLSERINSFKLDIEDINSDFSGKLSEAVIDDDEFANVKEKLDYFEEMKRKYGGSIDRVLDYKNKIEKYLDSINVTGDDLDQKISLLNQRKIKLKELAHQLSNERIKNIPLMEKLINNYLRNMDMNNVNFHIKNHQLEEPTLLGIDNIEFYISTNKGEDLKPLINVISGGELSRLMIAIKLSLNNIESANTLIFDEVDSGISGMTAEKVGREILKLSSRYQILCISHLSQISSKGKNHFQVSKEEIGDRTKVKVERLSLEDRKYEIAKLLSGKNVTDESLAQAHKMLEGYNG